MLLRGKVAEELGQAFLHLKIEKHTLVLKKLVISPQLATKSRRCADSCMGSYFPATLLQNTKGENEIWWTSSIEAILLAGRNLYPLLFPHKEHSSLLRDVTKNLSNHFIHSQVQDLRVMHRLFHRTQKWLLRVLPLNKKQSCLTVYREKLPRVGAIPGTQDFCHTLHPDEVLRDPAGVDVSAGEGGRSSQRKNQTGPQVVPGPGPEQHYNGANAGLQGPKCLPSLSWEEEHHPTSWRERGPVLTRASQVTVSVAIL